MSGFFEFLAANMDEFLFLILTHIRLAIISILVAITVGIPLGILISTIKGLDRPVLGFANIMQAVPSLAALGLLVPILGIGSLPAVLMVVLYSLLPILKNTYTGLVNINRQTVEAAYGIGMTPFQVLTKVRLPLAMPVIMSGVRISAVTAVGLMTIAAYIGAGGLGNYVISGIQTANANLMLAGALPACMLALLMDFAISKMEKAVMPISMSFNPSQLTQEKIKSAKSANRRTLATGLAVVVAVTGSFAWGAIASSQDRSIVVASKAAAEGEIIGHIISYMIEENTELTVERKLGMGATMIVFNALKGGEIDIYPEYSGSAYGGIYGEKFVPGTSPEQVQEYAKELLLEDDIIYMDMYGFNNSYCIGLLTETANNLGIKTISDLQKVSDGMNFGTSQEFPHREDGLPALEGQYGAFGFNVLQFQGTLMYDALVAGETDVMTPYTTDAQLLDYDVTILEDDKNALSSYTMATAIRSEIAEEYPELLEVLGRLEGAISNEEMTALNYEVVINQRSSSEVAWEFLVEKGLIKG